MGIGRGYGKAILFNEHFVVYGIPGIASAVGLTTTAEAAGHDEEGGLIIDDQRNATKGYKEGYASAMEESVTRMSKALGIDRTATQIKVTLGGDLFAAGGIGASAAACVSIARALNAYLELGLDDEQINAVAFEGEKWYAGTPSGIDNTASTFGGLIEFQRIEGKSVIKRMHIKSPIEVVMGNTGIIVHTKEIVAGVRERKEKAPEKFEKLFRDAEAIIPHAKQALSAYDVRKLGDLMDEANTHLEAIGISSPQLEKLITIARENSAWGAKITGSGVGGFMLALTPGKELQEKVASAIEQEGYLALRTTIG